MRHTFPTLLLLFFSLQLSAQVVQKGVVLEMSSGGRPAAGVEVKAMGAAPTDSDMNGHFTMNFPSAFSGDPLMRPEAYKLGYEIVNERALKTWNLTDTDTLKIVLGNREKINVLRRKYHDIGMTQMESRYAEALATLRKERENDRLSEIDFINKTDSLTRAVVRHKELLEEYSTRFARINTDDLDETERQALKLVQEGKIYEAMTIYEGMDLDGRISESHQVLSDTEEDIQILLRSVITKFRLHKEMEEHEACDSLALLIDRMAVKGEIADRLIYPEWLAARKHFNESVARYSALVKECRSIEELDAVNESVHEVLVSSGDTGHIRKLEIMISDRRIFLKRKEELLK